MDKFNELKKKFEDIGYVLDLWENDTYSSYVIYKKSIMIRVCESVKTLEEVEEAYNKILKLEEETKKEYEKRKQEENKDVNLLKEINKCELKYTYGSLAVEISQTISALDLKGYVENVKPGCHKTYVTFNNESLKRLTDVQMNFCIDNGSHYIVFWKSFGSTYVARRLNSREEKLFKSKC